MDMPPGQEDQPEQPAGAGIPAHHPGTAGRVFGDEAVIITPGDNMVRMLNPVGSRIWELADGQRSLDEIAAVLADEYQVTAAEAQLQVAEFVVELVAKGILVVASRAG